MIHEIKQENSVIDAFITRASKERMRIIFLFQNSALWSSWKSLWEACINDINIEATIILIESKYLDTKLYLFNQAKNFLIEHNIPFLMYSAYSIVKHRPHVIFVQTPYKDTLPEGYELESLQSIGSRVAYIPYGLEIGGGAMNMRFQFNLPLQQQAGRIFVRSQRHQQMYAKYCHTGSAHTIITGHPKTDFNQDLISIDPALIEKINSRISLLWCPHFSIKQNEWSTFFIYVDHILQYFSNHPELFLIVRPHPFLFSKLRDQANWSCDKISTFKHSIASMENAYLDLHADHHASFKVSDALIADAGSFLLGYLSTGKPVAYLHNDNGPGLNEDGDVTKYFYVINSPQDITDFVEMIAKEKDPKKEERCQAISEYLFQNENNAGLNIKNYLLSSVNEFDRPKTMPIKIDTQHTIADKYWRNVKFTGFVQSEFSENQKKVLKKILDNIGSFKSALDVGCGDGSFTKVINDYSQYTKAIDISPVLINKAKENNADAKIEFTVESIPYPSTCLRYDFVACMGVTSGLIDDALFLGTIDVLIASCNPGGYLLMQDPLSIGIQQQIQDNDQNYTVVYRNIDDYLSCFISRGCQMIEEHEIFIESSQKLIHKLFLFSIA